MKACSVHASIQVLASVALLLSGWSSFCRAGDELTATPFELNPAALDRRLASYRLDRAPGCSVALAQHGEIIYSGAFGQANLDYALAITPNTVFDVASITKQFTAAALVALEQDQQLSLDDSIRRWLPELPAYTTPIMLRHMLHHTSGFRDYLNLFPLAGRGDYTPISHAQIRAMMARQKALVFAPGERYEYSNTGYMLLAQVVERASGKPLDDYVEERFFAPLGLNHSYFYDDQQLIIPNRATGYDRNEDDQPVMTHNYNFDVVGDGQLYTTVLDLLAWDHYLHDQKPVIHAAMLGPGRLNNGQSIDYALGIELGEHRGQKTLGHSGSSWGFRSQLLRFEPAALSIAVACNADYARPGKLAYELAELVLKERLLTESPVPSSVEPATAQAFQSAVRPDSEQPRQALALEALNGIAGRYYSAELDAVYRFFHEGQVLMVRIEQEPALRVTSQPDGRLLIDFTAQGWPGPRNAHLKLQADDRGEVTGFLLDSGSERGLVFQRQDVSPSRDFDSR